MIYNFHYFFYIFLGRVDMDKRKKVWGHFEWKFRIPEFGKENTQPMYWKWLQKQLSLLYLEDYLIVKVNF
jgi:hypothetical protein